MHEELQAKRRVRGSSWGMKAAAWNGKVAERERCSGCDISEVKKGSGEALERVFLPTGASEEVEALTDDKMWKKKLVHTRQNESIQVTLKEQHVCLCVCSSSLLSFTGTPPPAVTQRVEHGVKKRSEMFTETITWGLFTTGGSYKVVTSLIHCID